MTHPKIGNMAPAFSLLDQHNNKVSLKDFKGKKNVVLYFYPRSLTPGCILQACGLRDIQSELKKMEFLDPLTLLLELSPCTLRPCGLAGNGAPTSPVR